MIQIRGIRTIPSNGNKYDTKVLTISGVDNPIEVLQNYEKHLSEIDDDQKWNLYVTAHMCDTAKRLWKSPQKIIFIDVDGIDINKVDAYIAVVEKVVEIKREEMLTVFSGNGIHVCIELETPITEEIFFDENRPYFKEICFQIDNELTRQNLPGQADPGVFSTARMVRLPGTENRKPGKEVRKTRLLQANSKPQKLDLHKLSKLPIVAKKDQLEIDKHFVTDTEGVEAGCLFLKNCKDNQNSITEPQWFGMLSIVGRLSREKAHEYSQNYKGYDHNETERKIDQALISSGPRTCESINNLWNGCSSCPHFKKLTSPIQIRGENFIGTLGSGFHDIQIVNGKRRLTPNYQDLMRYFEREHFYVTLGSSEIVYIWNGKNYEECPDTYLKNFAQTHFKPFAKTEMVNEFRNLVCRTNLRDPRWFDESTRMRMNFNNGVLLENGTFTKHSAEYGFRHVLPYDYSKDATAPEFLKFLEQIMCGDKELMQNFLEYTGYALSNDPIWLHKAWVMLGSGSNGKSTAMDLIRELAGEGNHVALSLGDLRSEGSRQMLDGKYFNMSEETPTRGLHDSTHFKNISAGGLVPVRQLYKKPYMMRNKAKLIFACNELPGSTDTTQGFFRRFLIMPFHAVFTDDKDAIARGALPKDPFVKDKLLKELPGIFNLCRDAYQGVKARGHFTKSSASEDALEEFKDDTDYTLTWITENLVREPQGSVPVTDCYTAYRTAMDSFGLEPMDVRVFGKRVISFIGSKHVARPRTKEGRIRTYVGVRLASAREF